MPTRASASLAGQVAIVTGGAQGIGGACCSLLAEVGARVLVVDLAAPLHGMPGPESKVAEIEAAGGEAAPFAADVSKPEEIEAMVARAVALWGRVDVLATRGLLT
jgi:NAD(P)-dependent dehydrogenase (short-subunit alcohol dehydrogenase family)